MKIYGNEPTELKLSDKSQEVYNNTDPLHIYEKLQDGGTYLYDITGCIEMNDLTENGLNEALEIMGAE